MKSGGALKRSQPRNGRVFSLELQRLLLAYNINIYQLAQRINSGRGQLDGVTQSIVKGSLYNIYHARRHPAGDTVKVICATLDLPADWRLRLHRAAAIDAGYEVGSLS